METDDILEKLRKGIDQARRGEVITYEPGHFTRLARELQKPRPMIDVIEDIGNWDDPVP